MERSTQRWHDCCRSHRGTSTTSARLVGHRPDSDDLLFLYYPCMLPNSSLIPAQSLEERGLVIKTPVQTQQSNPRSAQKLMTNLMHLKRFAPDVRLGPNQFLKVSAASKWSDTNLCKVITAHGRASLPWLVSPCHHSSCNIFICM